MTFDAFSFFHTATKLIQLHDFDHATAANTTGTDFHFSHVTIDICSNFL